MIGLIAAYLVGRASGRNETDLRQIEDSYRSRGTIRAQSPREKIVQIVFNAILFIGVIALVIYAL